MLSSLVAAGGTAVYLARIAYKSRLLSVELPRLESIFVPMPKRIGLITTFNNSMRTDIESSATRLATMRNRLRWTKTHLTPYQRLLISINDRFGNESSKAYRRFRQVYEQAESDFQTMQQQAAESYRSYYQATVSDLPRLNPSYIVCRSVIESIQMATADVRQIVQLRQQIGSVRIGLVLSEIGSVATVIGSAAHAGTAVRKINGGDSSALMDAGLSLVYYKTSTSFDNDAVGYSTRLDRLSAELDNRLTALQTIEQSNPVLAAFAGQSFSEYLHRLINAENRLQESADRYITDRIGKPPTVYGFDNDRRYDAGFWRVIGGLLAGGITAMFGYVLAYDPK